MKKQWLWTPPLPSHHLKLVRCPPEHDAIHPDGSLPILQGRFPCQVHKLLWADHMFIVLERSTEVQDLLRLTQAWWNCSTTHSPFQLQPAPGVHRKEWHGSTSHRPQYRTLWYSPSLEYAPVARGQGKGQLFTWYLACCSPKKSVLCARWGGRPQQRKLLVYSPTRKTQQVTYRLFLKWYALVITSEKCGINQDISK